MSSPSTEDLLAAVLLQYPTVLTLSLQPLLPSNGNLKNTYMKKIHTATFHLLTTKCSEFQ